MILHHFTCSHGAEGIQNDGLIVPHPQPFLAGVELSWFTDDPTLGCQALGLQSTILDCDRMRYHFLVAVPGGPSPWPTPMFRPWQEYAESRRLDQSAVSALNLGRSHGHWWVSEYPVEWSEVGWVDP